MNQLQQKTPLPAHNGSRLRLRRLGIDTHGSAWRKFVAICTAQGGMREPPRARFTHEIVAIGIHALFAEGAYEELKAAGVGRIITCNTVIHPSNGIDVTNSLSEAIREVAPSIPATGERHGT